MLNELRRYWDEKYREIQDSMGETNHLDKSKSEYFQNLEYFTKLYDNAGDAIQLACDIDEEILYPIAVIAMMNIFNPEVCYQEYCTIEFWESWGEEEWVCINLNEEEDGFFFLREKM